ncbi:MAG: PKD domain-containing protein [Imperialibacter sp.]|uniref:PKD domain-containing protein n=1 Tax=Imperialibacter sp. TaxID=2038411 RepID=UPI0032EAB5EA
MLIDLTYKKALLTLVFLAGSLYAAHAVPTATFTAAPVCKGQETVFVNGSTTLSGSITFYSWDFGDGQSSTVPSPRHVYASAGDFVVRLLVIDSNGDQDDFSTTVTVHPTATVNFSATAADRCVSTTQSFTDLTSIGGGSTITDFEWDFGDGTIANSATSINPTHDYAAAGTYTVTLTATTNNACESSLSKSITIYPDPVADFTFPGDVCLGESTVFTNNSSIASGNVTYTWDFDDGSSTSSQISPTHTFASDGVYDVSLLVTSVAGGCTDLITQQVEVFAQPVANFTFSDHCFEETASFTNTSTDAVSYLWSFGDGIQSTDTSPTHDYASPGTFEVTLEATSANNCVDAITKVINVRPNPVAYFEVDDTCLGTATAFTNLSTITSGPITYSWNFGDSSPLSTDTNPSYTYPAAGVYTVELTVTSSFTCEATFSTTVEIFATSVGGTLAGSTTRCEDDDAVYTLTLSGETGEVVRWERSLTGVDQWITIDNTTTSLDYSDLAQTTYFRALVQSGACAAVYSSMATIQIDELSVGGTLGGGTTVCNGTNSTTLELSGYTGGVVEWQSSASSAGPWTPIVSTATSMPFNNLTATTYYRVIVQNGVCSSSLSSVAEIEVSPATVAGLVNGSAVVCYGTNSGQLTLSGNTGGVVRWESSPTGEVPWAPVVNTTTTLDYENLLATSFYRAIVKSGVCEEKITNKVKVQVDPATVEGELSGPSLVCGEANEGTILLKGQTGAVLRWQESPDGTTWTSISNTTTSQSFTDLTATTFYRAEVQSGTCAAIFTQPFEVEVSALPNVAFSVQEVCEGLASQFVNTSTVSSGTVASQVWDFGDASSSVSTSPKHTYDSYGTYPVKLIVTSKAGCVDSLSLAAVVNAVPEVKFTQDDVCFGAPMDFSNLSTLALGSIDEIAWNFGDGATSSVQDPSYTFEEPGAFQASLTITSDKNCEASFSKQVVVFPQPVASFEVGNVCFGETATFKNNSSVSSGTLTYVWDFGDGTQSTSINPSHKYEKPGHYAISLTATTSFDCVSEFLVEIDVYEQPVASFSVEDICLDATAVFTNTSTGSDVSYRWEFGDGIVSEEVNPTHKYVSAGIYTVTLSVAAESGCSDQFSSKITVSPLPLISFVMEDVCIDKAVAFSNLSSIISGEVVYTWSFGDGKTSNEVSPVHSYEEAGVYTVRLEGASDIGCTTVLEKTVEVFPLPKPDFVAEPVCDGSPTAFDNKTTLASGAIASYLWNFGDQTNSIVVSPSKQYLNPGSYQASLLAESEAGCKAIVVKEVVVHDFPVANFTVANVCDGFMIEPANLSEIASGDLTYEWDFGDGQTSASANPTHLYEEAKAYTITLAANSGNNCKDIFQRQVTIYSLPEPDAGADTTVSKGYSALLAGSGGVSYVWSPIDGLANSNVATTWATPLQTTDYELLATDQFGCQNRDTVTVNVNDDYRIVASNVFTPDGNGQNDTWVIRNVETFGDVNVRVFDRFGTMVYQETAYQNDWQGTRGNDILPDGTYYYVITFSTSERKYNGALTIMRNR